MEIVALVNKLREGPGVLVTMVVSIRIPIRKIRSPHVENQREESQNWMPLMFRGRLGNLSVGNRPRMTWMFPECRGRHVEPLLRNHRLTMTMTTALMTPENLSLEENQSR